MAHDLILVTQELIRVAQELMFAPQELMTHHGDGYIIMKLDKAITLFAQVHGCVGMYLVKRPSPVALLATLQSISHVVGRSRPATLHGSKTSRQAQDQAVYAHGVVVLSES